MKKLLLLAGVACLAAANASASYFNPYAEIKAKYAFARNEVKTTGVFEDKNNFNDEVWGGSLALGNIFIRLPMVSSVWTWNIPTMAMPRKMM